MKKAVETQLKTNVAIKVRFSETDSMSVVWHGNYIRYFEDAREAFGDMYGITYLDVFSNGYYMPLVSLSCDYKSSLRYGDEALAEITFWNTPSAKAIFKYRIFNKTTNRLAATGSTIQVFLSVSDNALSINNPAFFENWKQKMGLL
ncbi:MAG: acyl-CoA thioesterase [Prevotellaceae bacterium]|jgi:acyl-CoA thioester hydrolase|nr:acyl-CoA thioesterase [Prevotellaceae bacterium]